LSEIAQVCSLGKVLSEQAIGIFVDTSLPWALRIGKVNFYAGRLGQALVLGHLLALIVAAGLIPIFSWVWINVRYLILNCVQFFPMQHSLPIMLCLDFERAELSKFNH
jgi:hypothetical protein